MGLGGGGMRQDSERTGACARVGTWWYPLDRAYATANTAHTAPHGSVRTQNAGYESSTIRAKLTAKNISMSMATPHL